LRRVRSQVGPIQAPPSGSEAVRGAASGAGGRDRIPRGFSWYAIEHVLVTCMALAPAGVDVLTPALQRKDEAARARHEAEERRAAPAGHPASRPRCRSGGPLEDLRPAHLLLGCLDATGTSTEHATCPLRRARFRAGCWEGLLRFRRWTGRESANGPRGEPISPFKPSPSQWVSTRAARLERGAPLRRRGEARCSKRSRRRTE